VADFEENPAVSFIDEVDLLSIKPAITCPSFEYSIQTVLVVLDEDEIIYLRKNGTGYSSYNKISGQFEILHDLTTQQTGLSSSWTVFAYETQAVIFNSARLDKIMLDQNHLLPAPGPEVWSIDTVQGLLPKFTRPFSIGPIQMKKDNIETLIEQNGGMNDLIIDSHLYLTASTAPANRRVLAVPNYFVSQIIEKRL